MEPTCPLCSPSLPPPEPRLPGLLLTRGLPGVTSILVTLVNSLSPAALFVTRCFTSHVLCRCAWVWAVVGGLWENQARGLLLGSRCLVHCDLGGRGRRIRCSGPSSAVYKFLASLGYMRPTHGIALSTGSTGQGGAPSTQQRSLTTVFGGVIFSIHPGCGCLLPFPSCCGYGTCRGVCCLCAHA